MVLIIMVIYIIGISLGGFDSCTSEEEEDLKEDIDINNIIKLDWLKVNGITYF